MPDNQWAIIDFYILFGPGLTAEIWRNLIFLMLGWFRLRLCNHLIWLLLPPPPGTGVSEVFGRKRTFSQWFMELVYRLCGKKFLSLHHTVRTHCKKWQISTSEIFHTILKTDFGTKSFFVTLLMFWKGKLFLLYFFRTNKKLSDKYWFKRDFLVKSKIMFYKPAIIRLLPINDPSTDIKD